MKNVEEKIQILDNHVKLLNLELLNNFENSLSESYKYGVRSIVHDMIICSKKVVKPPKKVLDQPLKKVERFNQPHKKVERFYHPLQSMERFNQPPIKVKDPFFSSPSA